LIRSKAVGSFFFVDRRVIRRDSQCPHQISPALHSRTGLFIVAVASARQGRHSSLDPATSDGRYSRHAVSIGAPAGRLTSQPNLVLCLRKTRGRKLPARSTSRSSSSARARSFWSSRPRRRPLGERATSAALTSATSSTQEPAAQGCRLSPFSGREISASSIPCPLSYFACCNRRSATLQYPLCPGTPIKCCDAEI
jgi:hypothetical protein